MRDYNPTTYLVRVLNKEDGTGMTMDTTDNDVMQQTVTAMVESVGSVFIRAYEIQSMPSENRFIEVITGATANLLSRREYLLNEARNLLIELEQHGCKKAMSKIVIGLVDEIGEEIGVEQ